MGTPSGAVARDGAKSRSAAVYGIRGIAAMGLLTVHVAMFSGLLGTRAFGEPRPPSNFFGSFLVSGMPSFIGVMFVLPAMYLYLPLAQAIISGERRPPQGRSFVKRLLRLLPAYYVMYLVVLLAFNRNAIDGVWFVLRPIFLLQVYLPTPFKPNFVNGMEVTWTVPSMVQWYIFLPLIAWAVHRFAARGATPLARAKRLLIPVPILFGVGVAWLFVVKMNSLDNRMVFWWPQGFAPTIGIGMGIAVLLALSKVSPKDTPGIFRLAADKPHLFWLGALGVYLVNCTRPFSVIGMDAIYSTAGLLVTYLMVAAFGLLATLPLAVPGARAHAVERVLALKPLAHLGKVSYGIYLWHFAMMHFYLQGGAVLTGDTRPIRELYGVAGFWELELFVGIGSIVVATLSFYLVEQPVARWGDALLRRWGARAGGGGLPAGGGRPALGGSGGPAGAVVLAEEVTRRDAIRANLIDLERSFGRQLLARGSLTGQTRQRWEAASADLVVLWDLFGSYSSVVDEAGGGRAGRAGVPLAEAPVLFTGAPAPLGQRHIADSGSTRLTVEAAVTRMDEMFTRVAELVTTVETVWAGVTERLVDIGARLARVRGLDPALDAAIVAAEAGLFRLHATLSRDPLALWRDGAVDLTAVDELAQEVDEITAKAPLTAS
ncbi:acyltransferase [Catellatospora sp. KI3]|uniref:acyltransferase family protein n=1 Tax=Catellatospora sp. KI3 TaxID=3041620 RepID=UPI002482AFBD|nr:acyltransferase [Catellatospora sp. KI3]MDI1461467.1 acyltransferase [Catellatospora sp. KI3]